MLASSPRKRNGTVPMTSDTDPGIATEIRWDKISDQAFDIQFANVFMAQYTPREDTYYIAIGRIAPPMIADLMNNPKERQRLERAGLTVTPVARIALSPPMILELMNHLKEIYDKSKHGPSN